MSSIRCIQCAHSSGFSILLGACGVYIKRLEAVGTAWVSGPALNEGRIFMKFRASVRIVSLNMNCLTFF